MSFVEYPSAIHNGNIPKGVVGVFGNEVYVNGNQVTGACGEVSEVGKGDSAVLNISKVTSGFQATCGHILEGGKCSYLSHVHGEETRCPLLESIEILNSIDNKKAA